MLRNVIGEYGKRLSKRLNFSRVLRQNVKIRIN